MFHYDTRITHRSDHTVVTKSPIDADSALALQYEAEMLGRIRHPNVVELLAAPDHDDPSMVTAFAGPEDLAARPPRDVTTARSVVRSLVATLGDLHRAGFAHGAVTPEHLVVGVDGRLTLCGFRRAREVGSEESAGCSADGRAVATMIRWWLATIETTRADAPIAQQLADVADQLDSDHPPTMRAIRALLDEPRRPGRGTVPEGVASAVSDRLEVLRRRVRRTAPTPPPRGDHLVPPLGGRDVAATAPSTATRRAAWVELRPNLLVIGFHLAAVAALALVAPFGRQRDPIVGLVTAGIWLLALAAGVLGALAGLASLIADRRDLPAVRRFAERTSVPWVRRAAAGIAAFGASATSVVALAGSSAPRTVATTASPTPRPASPDSVPSSTTPTSSFTSTSSTTSTSTTTTTTTVPVAPPTPTGAVLAADQVELTPTPEPAHPDSETWTVEPGDHLWSIAQRTLSDRLGHDVSAAEIAPYWERLVDENRARLVDPSNPDLILTGQVLVLPSP